jgi:CBS domain-containing protein
MVLRAKDIMDASFLTLDEETDALTCARAMVQQRKGYAVVTRAGDARVAGIVTEWDYVERIVVAQADPSRVRLKEIASVALQSCQPDTPTDEVVSTMGRLGIRRMIVRTDDRVVGIITAKNVLAIFRQYIDKLSAEIAGYQSSQTPLG